MGNLAHPDDLSRDPDIWWHLANARLLFATHHFLHADPYSFSLHAQPWVNPEWLAEAPYWLGYRWLGLAGVHLIAILALAANLLFVYFRSYARSRHISAAFWMAVLGFFLLAINAGARTIGLAYLALSAEMALLEAAENGRTRLLWLLPPLFCLWINLHGSWIIGLALFALYILCGLARLNAGVFRQEPFSAPHRNQLLAIFSACVAFLVVNPYGWRLVWNPFDMLLQQHLMLATMAEWQPLDLGSNAGKAAAVAIALALAANSVKARPWKLYELAFIFFAWYYAFAHQRFLFLACVVTLPWITADVARAFFGPANQKTIPALNGLIAAGILGGLALTFPNNTTLEKDLAAARPIQMIAGIDPSWRTFNDHALGGLMDFAAKPVFIDSRNDLFEHGGVYRDYLDIEGLRDADTLLAKYGIDHALIPSRSGLTALLRMEPDWQVVSEEGRGDDAFTLFARKAAAQHGAAAPAPVDPAP